MEEGIDGMINNTRMIRNLLRLAVVSLIPINIFVVEFWWYVDDDPSAMNPIGAIEEFIFGMTCFFWGPLSPIVGFALSCLLMYLDRLQSVFSMLLILPCCGSGTVAFLVNFLGFVFYISPGC